MRWMVFVACNWLCKKFDINPSEFLNAVHHVPLFGPTISLSKVSFLPLLLKYVMPRVLGNFGFLPNVVPLWLRNLCPDCGG